MVTIGPGCARQRSEPFDDLGLTMLVKQLRKATIYVDRDLCVFQLVKQLDRRSVTFLRYLLQHPVQLDGWLVEVQ